VRGRERSGGGGTSSAMMAMSEEPREVACAATPAIASTQCGANAVSAVANVVRSKCKCLEVCDVRCSGFLA
jgi:hypothetical protein